MVARKFRKFIALLLSICIVFSQNVTAYAETNLPSEKQFSSILDEIYSIIDQLYELGLDDSDIREIFTLTKREDSFYTMSKNTTSSFSKGVCKQKSCHYFKKYCDACEKLSDSSEERKSRIEKVFQVALQYYDTDFYQGEKNKDGDFGRYMTYLYISHFIDGPGRMPVSTDMPYIISSSDISAYDIFINDAHLSYMYDAFVSLGATLYSDFDCIKSLNAINGVKKRLLAGIQDAISIGANSEETISTLKTTVPM
ncbi:MAG: hypothetical protein ACI4CX_05190, partial [Candidatus Weimeria sp.]